MKHTASAPGKIILSGEYAVLFGYPGIAIPAPLQLTASLKEGTLKNGMEIDWHWSGEWKQWDPYLRDIITELCCIISERRKKPISGTLHIQNDIPLGKGMGASTALVIAIARCLLGENCREEALRIEDAVNPGHSGIDFAVIWENRPLIFKKGSAPQAIDLPKNLLRGALLMDTGTPDQATPELVAWIKSREEELQKPLEAIGRCSERLLSGEDLPRVFRDHVDAQERLGIVSPRAKSLIKKIVQKGGSAKVIGAGGRSGGSGMVLALGVNASEIPPGYPIVRLAT